MNILIIAGHGNGDPGACSCGYQEASLVREIAPILKDKLASYANVTIFDISKNMYTYLKLNSFNFKQYDYVLELHFNAGAGDTTGNSRTTGTEILVHPFENNTTVEQAILNNICAVGFKNRGIKTRSDLQNMNICKGRQGVSYALLETCFIDDLDDVKLYQANKNSVIAAIANGIITGFGLNSEQSIEEEEEMTQEKFNQMMNNWIAESANKMPGDWSLEERKWAEKEGLIQGDDKGRPLYKKFITREEFVVVLKRFWELLEK